MKTVSNVMGGYAPVSEPTRTKVLAAVDQVGYPPISPPGISPAAAPG